MIRRPPRTRRALAAIVALVVVAGGTSLVADPVIAASPSVATGATSAFRPVGPVRLADTRAAGCGCTRLDEHTIRVVVAGRNGIAADVVAAAVTLTATGGSQAGFATAYPAGIARPGTSTINLSGRADTSNSAIIPVGTDGAIDVYSSVDTELILDVSGAFAPATASTDGRYTPVAPTRLADTRTSVPAGLVAGGLVTVALPAGVPTDATAVAVNVTSVGMPAPGFLTGYAAGAQPPATSFLNPDGSGSPVAGAVILPVSAQGFTIAASAGGHVIVDLVGWFTGPSTASSSTGLFTALDPVRLLDTRTSAPRLWLAGTREVASPVSAAALVTNVTVTAADAGGFVTAYPAGTPQPPTSTLNAAGRNDTRPNLAITTLSDRGVAFYSNAGTDLVVDITGYFTGAPVAATLPVPTDTAPVPRVLMIGDSTLGGFVDVPQAKAALQGFTPVLDAKPCRRLVHPSCTSRFTLIAPNTAIDAIGEASGPFDAVIVKTGYNDSASDFESSLAAVMAASRAKGARVVIWLTYAESNNPGSYDRANATLKRLAGSAQYPDLVVADWRTYAAGSSNWYAADRVHLMTAGVWATGDYLSRWVASVSHLPCPQPWTVGAAIDNPCPSPDVTAAQLGATPDLHGLYHF